MAYRIKLDIFEGPLDLLLHLIKKNEVDIYDIPIATITEQYLEYLEMMKAMNLELAGEFLVMAATLAHIKSKMLLPPSEEPEDEETGEDPREELVRRLLEYQRYKEAARVLGERLVLGRDVFTRGMPVDAQEGEEVAFVGLSLFDLVDALNQVLSRAPKTHVMNLSVDKFRVVDKINYIMDILNAERSVTFASLFPPHAERGEIIVTFLALLELAKLLMIRIHQTDDGIIRVYIPAKEALPAVGSGTD